MSDWLIFAFGSLTFFILVGGLAFSIHEVRALGKGGKET